MNILIFSWRGQGHPNEGGAEVSTHEHAKGWVKGGHSVTLFTAYYKRAKKEEEIDGLHIIRSGRQIFGVHMNAFKWYLFGNHERFDLVVDQFHGIPFFTPLYVRAKKLAFIHEVTKEVWLVNAWSNLVYTIPFIVGMILEPLIFRIFYHHIPFMTVSESTKKDLINWGILEENINVINNGINKPLLQKLPEKEKSKTLIFLGTLTRDKGMEDALEAFSILGRENQDWQLWVVGKGATGYLRWLKQLAQKLDIDRKVKFWGFVSEEKKFELLARSHILINPSIREGWGLVVIEAASVGTPTVGYNVAGLRDSIKNGETGILCNPDEASSTEVIVSLMSDQKKYQRLAENCLKWAKQFSWDKSVKKSLAFIEKLARS